VNCGYDVVEFHSVPVWPYASIRDKAEVSTHLHGKIGTNGSKYRTYSDGSRDGFFDLYGLLLPSSRA
jgi:hypothetical protein